MGQSYNASSQWATGTDGISYTGNVGIGGLANAVHKLLVSSSGLTPNGIKVVNVADGYGVEIRSQGNDYAVIESQKGYLDFHFPRNARFNNRVGISNKYNQNPDTASLLDVDSNADRFMKVPGMKGSEAELISIGDSGRYVFYCNNGNGTVINTIGFWGFSNGNWRRLSNENMYNDTFGQFTLSSGAAAVTPGRTPSANAIFLCNPYTLVSGTRGTWEIVRSGNTWNITSTDNTEVSTGVYAIIDQF